MSNMAESQASSSLRLAGVSFAFADYTPSGRLGSVECTTMMWASSTSAVCTGSTSSPHVVTVGGAVGTTTLSFTIDGAYNISFEIDPVCHSKERPMLAYIVCVCMSAVTPTSFCARAAPVVRNERLL